MKHLLRKLQINHFYIRNDHTLFRGFLKLKHDVFIKEFYWTKIPHDAEAKLALPDHYDEESLFCVAVNAEGEVMGGVRGTLPTRFKDMYRVGMYTNFIARDFVHPLEGRVATINAMAVRPAYRWQNCANNASPLPQHQAGLSDQLMSEMATQLAALGAEVIILSAISGPSYDLMKRCGYKTFSAPHTIHPTDYSSMPQAPPLHLFDMALIIRHHTPQETPDEHRPLNVAQTQALTKLGKHLQQTDRKYCEQPAA